jgi:FAD:protein FMN transferase
MQVHSERSPATPAAGLFSLPIEEAMSSTSERQRVLGTAAGARGLTRREFLASLGVLAGAGALAPIIQHVHDVRTRSVEVERAGLGTWIRIVARDRDRERASRGIEAAFAAIRRVDRQMSIHRSDSQLTLVNARAGHAPAAVDADVLDVVERAYAAAARSGGVYDPTVLPLMRLYGFYRDVERRYPSDHEIATTLERTGWRGILLDRAAGTLALARTGMGLDLGSIGKGWAVDRAVAALVSEGIHSGLVDVGGNVYGLGTPDEGSEGWSVGVLHPVTREVDRVFRLENAAVATSANNEQFKILGGLRVGHLFDARQGRPSDGHMSASVVAPTGVESDVMSTAAFLLGPSPFSSWPRARAVHFIG